MKSFLIGGLFVFATFFPIVFVPLLVISVLVSVFITPRVIKDMGWTNDPHIPNRAH